MLNFGMGSYYGQWGPQKEQLGVNQVDQVEKNQNPNVVPDRSEMSDLCFTNQAMLKGKFST